MLNGRLAFNCQHCSAPDSQMLLSPTGHEQSANPWTITNPTSRTETRQTGCYQKKHLRFMLLHYFTEKKNNCGFIVLKPRTHQHVLTAKRNEYFQKGRDKINRQYELRNKLYFCKFILVALKTSRIIMFRHKPPNCTEQARFYN